jgi:hypothetical protein
MVNTNKRPWQGWVITIIYFLMILSIFYITVENLTAYVLTFIILQNPSVAAKFLDAYPGMLATQLVIISLISIIMTAIFFGKKGAIIIALVIQTFLIAYSMYYFGKLLIASNFKMAIIQLIGFTILGGIGWLMLYCLKHPFYGGNGKITLDTFKFWKKRISGGEEMTTF